MLEFIRSLRRDGALATRLPALFLAFGIAEFFYKFKSFALECAAFLVTWLVIDLICDRFWPRRSQAHSKGSHARQEPSRN